MTPRLPVAITEFSTYIYILFLFLVSREILRNEENEATSAPFAVMSFFILVIVLRPVVIC